MPILQGKRILIGITGGIAAYKVAFLVRLLRKQNACVRVVMTTDAKQFVTPLTLATLSGQPVVTDFIKQDEHTTDWNNHVKLALWADYILIAPTTANTLSKLAIGQSDNLLTTIYLSSRCPILIAPAMDMDMWQHPTTIENIQILKDRGHTIIVPATGELASGLYGQGRMSEPETIISILEKEIITQMPFYQKTILITAGPTHEMIDPVRFVGNKSSGKMGFELTKTALSMGANVILITGPTEIALPEDERCQSHRVTTAQEMFDSVNKYTSTAEVIIMAAAVADYMPEKVVAKKIKKSTAILELQLQPTKDILAHLGQHKKPKQFLMGFALESHDEVKYAIRKLKTKNLDAIVLNSLRDSGAGFGIETNKITIIDRQQQQHCYDLKPKSAVAVDILNFIYNQIDLTDNLF